MMSTDMDNIFDTSNNIFQYDSSSYDFSLNPNVNQFFDFELICPNIDHSPVFFEGENILFGNISLPGKLIYLKSHLVFNIQLDSDHININIEALDLDFSVDNFDDILPSLKEQLLFLWEEYALESDNFLTPDAILLKNNILSIYIIENLS